MNSVITIGTDAFYGCTGLSELFLGESVKEIRSAFTNCISLKSLNIPASVTTIYSSSFLNCTGLQQISVAPGNKYYDSRDNCNAIIKKSNNRLILGCVTTEIPRTVTELGDYAFSGCKLKSFEVPRQITTIGNGVFRSCKTISDYSVEEGNNVFVVPEGSHAIVKEPTKELVAACPQTVIPEDISSIQSYAFFDYQIPSINLPEKIIQIGNYAFAYNNFSEINLPGNLENIGEGCFKSCSKLKEITIPQQVSIINDDLFYNCISLQKIILPESITYVARNPFYFCKNLNDIYCYAEQVPIRDGSGYNSGDVEAAITLHVPEKLVESYKNTNGWSKFGNIVALNDDDPKPMGINEVRSHMTKTGNTIYDLNGRRLTEKPKSGYYIQGGKKYFVEK